MHTVVVPSADLNYQSQLVIDFQRGKVLHSSTMTPLQYTRYFRTQSNKVRPDLGEFESTQYWNLYWFGQKYLSYLISKNLKQIQNLAFHSSPTFFSQNIQMFLPNFYKLTYPMVQTHLPHILRNNKDRNAIVDYIKKRFKKNYQLGASKTYGETQQQTVKRLVNKYRSIVFDSKKKQKINNTQTEESD